ncbi:hypothetical protein [Donghicola eburneus]|uniref:Uncharacterized protein n=1 Tax=Donghicola eburneus TaxID=393278 RepID=A0A1M4N0M6_9RHOB|nr:hypothetical protein [Donghicola eburneus]SCM68379.1 hypothetical protein KARMA_2597 [Donghicola eburneus]SFQ22902.1 hypothetical protein SAMN05421764_102196 [Donghicola eburneus]
MTVDPDKAMKLSDGNSVSFNVNDFEPTSTIGALVRTTQYLKAHLDALYSNSDWRMAVYKEVFEDLTVHNQEGTGSEREAAMLKATELVAQVLGVENK